MTRWFQTQFCFGRKGAKSFEKDSAIKYAQTLLDEGFLEAVDRNSKFCKMLGLDDFWSKFPCIRREPEQPSHVQKLRQESGSEFNDAIV